MSTSSTFAAPPKTTRSRVTNGSSLHVSKADGRTMEARRFRDVLTEIVSDLGGSEHIGEGQRQLARRAAMMSTACEFMEARSVAGEPIDLEAYGQLSDRIGRAFQRLGIKRHARRIDNPLVDHFSRPHEREAPR